MRLAALVASGKLTCQAAKICSPFGRCISIYIYITYFPIQHPLSIRVFPPSKTGRHLEGPSSLIRKGWLWFLVKDVVILNLIPQKPFYTPGKTNMKATSWKLWKMILPFHFGVIFRFQLLVFLEVSNFSGSQHQTLSSYQTIIIPTDLNKLNRKKRSQQKHNF